LVAAFAGLSGDAPVIVSIAAGSCLVAGLLFSVGSEGRGGAIEVLRFPLVVAVIIVMAAISSVLGGGPSATDFRSSLSVLSRSCCSSSLAPRSDTLPVASLPGSPEHRTIVPADSRL
jgi:hypothetical protein